MRSTMMDTPLTISTILRYGTTAYAGREVVTATPGGVRRRWPAWPVPCAVLASTVTSGSPR